MPYWQHMHAELRRRGVTLVLLWKEYRADHADGYGYSRFCDLYLEWRRGVSATMCQIHVAGEKLFVDYAGDVIPCGYSTQRAAKDGHPEALAIEVDQSIHGEQVVETMARLLMVRGAPRTIRVDNGPEFVSKALDRCVYENGVALDFSRPGKASDNAFVEFFKGRLRDECLNAHWFLSLADARSKIEAWRRQYNECRPHTALGWLTPQEFALLAAEKAAE